MSIFVNNYEANDFVPRGIVNLVRGRGLATAENIPRRICLIGQMKTTGRDAGSAATNEAHQVYSERPNEETPALSSATELFGAGSELHLMCRAVYKAYPGANLWAIPVELKVDSNLRATAKITLTGTAKRVGEWWISIHGTRVQVRIEKDDTAQETLKKIATALNTWDDLPLDRYDEDGDAVIDPEGSSQVLTIPANHYGEHGNYFEIHRRGGVAGQAMTIDSFSGGAGVNDLESAFKVLEKQRFHYIVVANTDEDQLSKLRGQLDSIANPKIGLRAQAVFGWNRALDEGATNSVDLAGTLNSPRMQCVWSKGSAIPPGELAAAMAGHRAWMEAGYPAVNLSGHTIVGVPRPRLPSDLPSHRDLDTALHSGVTPLNMRGTEMSIVRSVTTCSRNETGGGSYELLDTNKVTTSDYIADDVAIRMEDRYKGFKLSPDTDAPIPSRTATPMSVRKSIIEWLREYEKKGLVRRVNESIEAVKVEISDEADGRIDFEVPEAVVDICAVTAGNLIRY
ncbi:MAG: hypothetical protein GY854_32440 [Deltaproteobacteria bacterium]|nr:hypothetical protein [Deltaproteobacteria bacterium]